MILDPNGMPIIEPLVDSAELDELLNPAFAAVGNALVAGDKKSPVKVPNAAGRDALFPAPTQGDTVTRVDLGYEERYYAAFNASSNPGGVTPAGWYATGIRASPPGGITNGSPITGIVVTTATPPVGSQMVIKSGFSHAFTTASFGNGYMPLVTFPTKFPNFCTGIGVTMIVAGTSTYADYALDTMNASNFRVMFPGTGVAERAYTWIAIGY